MEQGQRYLPEDVVEKIVVRMPFPSILIKARCLSKAWLRRFSSISSLNDQGEKCLAASFQRKVGERSNSWDTFGSAHFAKCDGYLGTSTWCAEEELNPHKESFAYNAISNKWQKVPSLSFLPKNADDVESSYLQLEGALIYKRDHLVVGDNPWYTSSLFNPYSSDWTRTKSWRDELFVANILTCSWKELPHHPGGKIVDEKFVSFTSLEMYNVFLLCENCDDCTLRHKHCYTVQIYDSKSNSWISKIVKEDDLDQLYRSWITERNDNFSEPSTIEYLYGVLYIGFYNDPHRLLAFDIGEGTTKAFNIEGTVTSQILMSSGSSNIIDSLKLLVHDADLLMIVNYTDSRAKDNYLILLKVDLGSLRLWELTDVYADPPIKSHMEKMYGQPDIARNCLFWRQFKDSCTFRVLAYNMDEQVWSYLPHPSEADLQEFDEYEDSGWYGVPRYEQILSYFQPGLRPFMEV